MIFFTARWFFSDWFVSRQKAHIDWVELNTKILRNSKTKSSFDWVANFFYHFSTENSSFGILILIVWVVGEKNFLIGERIVFFFFIYVYVSINW